MQIRVRTLRAWLLVFFFLQSIYSHSSIVKIESRFCGDDQNVRYSTGYSENVQGVDHLFVFTTAHGIYHGDQEEDVCHYIVCDHVRCFEDPIRLSIFKLDALTDRAIFIPYSQAEATRATTDLNNEISLPFQSPYLQISGFPVGSTSVSIDSRVKLINNNSSRHPFGNLERVIEVNGVVERGMSGSPTFDLMRREVIGILSHKRLEPNTLGGDSILKDIEVTRNPYDSVELVIPIKDFRTFAIQDSGRYLTRFDVESQRNNIRMINLGGLTLREDKDQCQPAMPMEFLAKTSRNLELLSGGDGVGVGGSRETDQPCFLKVSYNSVTTQNNELKERLWSENPWWKKIESLAYHDKEVIIHSLQGKKRLHFTGILSLFKGVHDGYRPVASFAGFLGNSTEIEGQLAETSRNVESLIASSYVRKRTQVIRFLEDIKRVINLCQNQVTPSEAMRILDQILDENSDNPYYTAQWNQLFILPDPDYDIVLLLYSQLHEIRKIASKMEF